MCGAAAGDTDPYHAGRTIRLTIGHILDKSKGGSDKVENLRAICANCNEGLQNTTPPKPDRIHLLAMVRRATIDDQRAVLNWLNGKFGRQEKSAAARE
ncbi:MAG: HNH endonuclease [Opitutaceae bacterium]|nr:HNH endonuclease [Opitutaceae bacterium]